MQPDAFERLCQRFLREAVFQQVAVTGRSGDGGIDGKGLLQINPLLSIHVLFQCTRCRGTADSSEIRNFRGAMTGRTDKGIFITTETFTEEAKREDLRQVEREWWRRGDTLGGIDEKNKNTLNRK